MTAEKLIEIVEICVYMDRCTTDCPYWDGKSTNCTEKLLGDVADRLEEAYTDLKSDHNCCHCKYHDICEHNGDDVPTCTNGNMWEWAGDSE